MWNFVNTMGHPGHLMNPFATQKRDFSLNVPTVPILPGKTFTNPNFVNKHHPSVHSYQNNFILTPIHKVNQSDSVHLNISQPQHANSGLVNSSQSIVDKVKENQIEVLKTEPKYEREIVREPVMCNSRKRSSRSSRYRRGKVPGKNSKQNKSRQQINDMMDIDLEVEAPVNICDSMSPKTQSNSYSLTDFIIEKPNKTKPIKIERNRCDSEEEDPIFTAEISFSPVGISMVCMRERQASVTESEDSFIIFDSGTDEELEFSEDSEEESDSETSEDEVDSSSSVIPHKRVRFANDPQLCEIHPMVQWSFAYQQARKGPWEEYARDRDRFNKRITQTEKIIAPVFDAQHREKVYRERFKEKMFSF